ncbi:cytochrome P450 [Lactarius hatsudake]|nr:cytochrome P450 [Lactarius hatsudake]
MYSVVVTLLQLLWKHELPSSLFLSLVSLCRHQRRQDTPALLPLTGQRLFQFRLLRNNVVVVSGEQGRRDFFNAKGLDLQEGFTALSGAVPIIHGVTTGLRQNRVAKIYRRLANAQRGARLTEMIPEVLNDGRRLLRPWEKAGTVDPFDRIPETAFDKVDRGTTPATVLFPWFPSPAMISKARATTKQIYDIIVNAIKVRKQSGVSHNDNLQLFLDSGDEVSTIVAASILFISALSEEAPWLITYLGCHPRWRDEARAEVEGLISSHALETISACDSPLPSSTALSSIPSPPQPHTAARRNVGPEMYIDGRVIPTGTLVVYPFSDVHLNPALYPDPWRFDPARPQLQADSYVGWGGGKVTCPGSRTAKLTMKLITALLLLDFDFDTVDQSGRIADPHPIPDWNDALACKRISLTGGGHQGLIRSSQVSVYRA